MFNLEACTRRKKALIKVMNDLTTPIRPGGWNSERVYIQDQIRAAEERIKQFQTSTEFQSNRQRAAEEAHSSRAR